jgi:hypothetical protein
MEAEAAAVAIRRADPVFAASKVGSGTLVHDCSRQLPEKRSALREESGHLNATSLEYDPNKVRPDIAAACKILVLLPCFGSSDKGVPHGKR